MKYDMTHPCDQCPFLKSMSHGFTLKKLEAFASGEFPCHKTAALKDGYDDIGDETTAGYVPKRDGSSQHCAGALIFNEKRNQPHQMMRIVERLGMYDFRKLDMEAPVR